jgi:hypothetical protein
VKSFALELDMNYFTNEVQEKKEFLDDFYRGIENLKNLESFNLKWTFITKSVTY